MPALKKKNNSKLKYKPTTDIFKLFGLIDFPYQSRISFAPLIGFWKKQLDSTDLVQRLIATEIDQLLSKVGRNLEDPINNLDELKGLEKLIALLTSVYYPFHDAKSLVRLTGPFNTLPFYHSEAVIELMSKNSIKTNLDQDPEKIFKFIVYRAGCMILNTFYNQNLTFDTPYIFSIKQGNTVLAKHYQAEINSSFTFVKRKESAKELSHNQIQELLSHVEDVDLWLKYLPPSDYEFQGIFCTLLTDTTGNETLSQLKEQLLQKDALISDERITQLENNLCTFFNETDLRLGVCSIEQSKIHHLDKDLGIRHGLISDKFSKLISLKTEGSIYDRVAKSKSFVVIENLDLYRNPGLIELELLQRGFKSILVAPLLNKNNSVIGILELASTIPFRLNSLSVLKLKNIISLFNVAMERSQIEVINQIEAIIRKNFTSIHPSIEWAFVDVAAKQLAKNGGTDLLDEDQFVFRDIYPLYGQADIVGSTMTRNKAIQADLIENLYQIKKLLTLSNKYYTFPLADQIIQEVDRYIGQLKRVITSNSEYMIMDFIRNEVHPLLKHLKKKSTAAKSAYYKYVNTLDPQLRTIYKRRKDYESSVSTINRTLSSFLDIEQDSAQEMCPHYFEKFQTDGVSYNIYIGQSLLRKGRISSFHLKNIRLWQLISMCKMTKKIVDIQSDLPIPLTTAQLILVHSSPISIRFRMDEKRFDVDGAYNARYEIIKKRIDKALIEGTNERLTIAGKIAIVYQQEKDKKEYLRYFSYLIKKGFIDKDIEDLVLRKLQGVQGLKALRVTVKV